MVRITSPEPVVVTLQDPSGLYTGGGLEFVVGKARATISYLVVTEPQH